MSVLSVLQEAYHAVTDRRKVIMKNKYHLEASRGAGAQSVSVNRLVVGVIPTRGDDIYIYIYIFIFSLWCRGESAALSSATQHTMPPEIGGKWGTECLNTKFPLPTLLCAGYRMKLKKIPFKTSTSKVKILIFKTVNQVTLC